MPYMQMEVGRVEVNSEYYTVYDNDQGGIQYVSEAIGWMEGDENGTYMLGNCYHILSYHKRIISYRNTIGEQIVNTITSRNSGEEQTI